MYKQIEIDNFKLIQKQLHTRIEDIKTNKRDAFAISFNELFSISPQLINWLDHNKLIFDIARFFVTPPLSSIGIHVDGTLPDYPKFLALNLPVLNCTNSHMVWWDNVEVQQEMQFNEYGGKIQIYDSPYKTIIDKLELTSPHLVKINYPHSVDNSLNNYPRIILSLRFKPEPMELFNSL